MQKEIYFDMNVESRFYLHSAPKHTRVKVLGGAFNLKEEIADPSEINNSVKYIHTVLN